ncbi:hypothetical protein AMTRI_Chr02g259730 [Amborella trichopoda]
MGEEGLRSPSRILYETCYHASSPPARDPSHEQQDENSKKGILSFLPFQGIKQLKGKWDNYMQQKPLKKEKFLIVSSKGVRIAVVIGNKITILWKDDNYTEPHGIFIGPDSTLRHGAWVDDCWILGVIDDLHNLFFINSNAEVMTRVTENQLKMLAPSVGLFLQDTSDDKGSSLCSFNILTSDGILHRVEVDHGRHAFVATLCTSHSQPALKQCPSIISCLDFHPELSLLVLVGPAAASGKFRGTAGLHFLYICQVTSKGDLEPVIFSTHFEGLFSMPKSHGGPFISPKVEISPHGRHIAVLDMGGSLGVFNVDHELRTLSPITFMEPLTPEGQNMHDILDFTWWSEHALIIAKRTGIVTILDIPRGAKLLNCEPRFSMPVFQQVRDCVGHAFLLDRYLASDEIQQKISFETGENRAVKDIVQVLDDKHVGLDAAGLGWTLISLSERSVSEMYKILLNRQQYTMALKFAACHGLDKDDVLKAQWMQSDHGSEAINVFLLKIEDQSFSLSECIRVIGPTEDAVNALLSHGLHITEEYKFEESTDNQCRMVWDFRMIRLQLLQYRDRLDTFLGINMGRFSRQGYGKFRSLPLHEVAVSLAETGKIGALNLFFKRHAYSLAPFILDILAVIPETVPVQTYGQLLPGRSPPSNISLRDKDWVECERMVACIKSYCLEKDNESNVQFFTEHIIKLRDGFVWPSVLKLSEWYRDRALHMDLVSGQLENSLTLVEFACHKGIVELKELHKDISCLCEVVFSDVYSEEKNRDMSLIAWRQLSDYEKFRMMIMGVREGTLVTRLREKAIPFMHNRSRMKVEVFEDEMRDSGSSSVDCNHSESFMVLWLKEMALENQLEVCLKVIEEGCKDFHVNGIFTDETEAVDVSLYCIYSCTLTDCWNTMASILSKLPHTSIRGKSSFSDKDFSPRHGIRSFGRVFRKSDRSSQPLSPNTSKNLKGEGYVSSTIGNDGEQFERSVDTSVENLEKRIKVAEGHVEAGRLLAYYQVAKPIRYFLEAHSDAKGIKQLIRLILSKFGRRQPGRSDNDWANMWRDMQCLQEKAFPFLDVEYMLTEFCGGLLKAGKFSLARNYLKGTGSNALAADKAEKLVIQAAREYLFSASSFDCSEIWKAKECLNLFPNSKTVKAEADIIDALTIKLPNLGVTLLPMQFRQIRDPMEIIRMVITSQSGAYLNVDELIEIAKLFGLNSSDDIAAVEEAVSREAAVAGDLQLAFDLCLALARKGYGSVWDLCAAIGRGLAIDDVDIKSRKELLGFALCHCDDESVGEILHAWKELDMQSQSEKLVMLSGTEPANFSVPGSSLMSFPFQNIQGNIEPRDLSELVARSDSHADIMQFLDKIRGLLSAVAKTASCESECSWDSIVKENGKILSFAALQLPWLLELCGSKINIMERADNGRMNLDGNQNRNVRMQALATIMCWLANNDVALSDHLITSYAKEVILAPNTGENDILGCSYLLNLLDAFRGVAVIEEQLHIRNGYQEVSSIMNMGMTYSSLHNFGFECGDPEQRRQLLINKFLEKQMSFNSDMLDGIDNAQSTFWREWKSKLEEQKRLADRSKALEEAIPGVETTRFLSGDMNYIQSIVYSFVESVRQEKKPVLKKAIKIAAEYGLKQNEVLLTYLGSALVSEVWSNDDIAAEISDYQNELLKDPEGVIRMISTSVYPLIDGINKLRLAYLYSILSDCHLQLNKTAGLQYLQKCGMELYQFCKVLEQECQRVSFIENLNFKNIAGLDNLVYDHFNEQVLSHVSQTNVEALAKMVQNLVGIHEHLSETKGLITWKAVYKQYIMSLLKGHSDIDNGVVDDHPFNSDDFRVTIGELESKYDSCRVYLEGISEGDLLEIMTRFYELSLPPNPGMLSTESTGLECLILLLTLWVRLADDILEIASHNELERDCILFCLATLSECLKSFSGLVIEGRISAHRGWETVSLFDKTGLLSALTTDRFGYCRAMVYAGCEFSTIFKVFFEVLPCAPTSSFMYESNLQGFELHDFYLNVMESIFSELGSSEVSQTRLANLLSSLSKMEDTGVSDCVVNLQKVRSMVWERLNSFAENMQLPSQTRVYALELLQCITGRHVVRSKFQPWEGWDETLFSEGIDISEQRKEGGVPSRLRTSLVALKSTDLTSAAWPGVEITPEDLMTTDSAFSIFMRLSTSSALSSHMNTLQALLEEWEGLFTPMDLPCSSIDVKDSAISTDSHDGWNGDEWDEGWDTFHDEPLERLGQRVPSVCVNPLHACWFVILEKLSVQSQFSEAMKLLDHSVCKQKGILIAEDEAHKLSQFLLGISCVVAIKIMLLLPYETIWYQCLTVLEAKLKDGSVLLDNLSRDYELLTIMLTSGILSVVALDLTYGTTFSCMCYLTGSLSRIYQEGQLSMLKNKRTEEHSCLLFCGLLFPCFIAELVRAKQYLVAGAFVLQFMHVHPSLCLVNVAEASLCKYLEGQIQTQENNSSKLDDLCSSNTIGNTVSTLRGKLKGLLRDALSSLSADMK